MLCNIIIGYLTSLFWSFSLAFFIHSFLFQKKMSKFKLEVPVDLSESTSSMLDTAKKVLHLVTLATTLLTICVVAPMIATEARYLVKAVTKKKSILNNYDRVEANQDQIILYLCPSLVFLFPSSWFIFLGCTSIITNLDAQENFVSKTVPT